MVGFNGSERVSTVYGKVKGDKCQASGTIRWLGIPYALPPVGKLRWRAPQEPAAWDGSRDALHYGNICTQGVEGAVVGGEDCLYLNIWRPDHAQTGLPVLVFAHGGGNLGGSGQDLAAEALARETDSVVVSLNYRLGAFGFFRHPALRTGDPLDDSGNYGLLDLLCALRYVQANIRAFGGDPERVTLGGHSAGARNVLAACLSPLGRGLFRQAVVLSGGMTTADPRLGDERSEQVMRKLRVRSGEARDEQAAADWLAAQPAERIADWLRSLSADCFAGVYESSPIHMGEFPQLFTDGYVLPAGGFNRLAAGGYAQVPLLIGSTAAEFALFGLSIMAAAGLPAERPKGLYEQALSYSNALYGSFNAEQPAERLAAVPGQPPVYAYRFRWGSDAAVTDGVYGLPIGAFHGIDMMFYTGDETVIEAPYRDGYLTATGKSGRAALTALLRGYLKRFLHSGNPNGAGLPRWDSWQADTAGGPAILELDADEQKASARMSAQLRKREAIVAELEADAGLTAQQRDWLRDVFWTGRFFWRDE
ncbi:carboxylesterase/lipase family protein [Paenibacillus athensensis]|uniref:Carboxylic ester hydrolase n=1 Tax=Paenibacillus athensensis TaxID=1967502 RepID=A0A4Y8PTF0_9BACL|nr:carboxylesterase family protein [Paenibacillus athensensis]MCD1261780.1 carboxylesterase/lipase family protein [Paenibacillus athensensis]